MNLPLQPSPQVGRQQEVAERSNPLWFKTAIVYEAHVKALRDGASGNRIDYELSRTSEPLDAALFAYLARRSQFG